MTKVVKPKVDKESLLKDLLDKLDLFEKRLKMVERKLGITEEPIKVDVRLSTLDSQL